MKIIMVQGKASSGLLVEAIYRKEVQNGKFSCNYRQTDKGH